VSAPYDIADVSRRAEALSGELAQTNSYAADVWNDPIFGPLLRIYLLFSYCPKEAFDKPQAPAYLADCHLYAFVYFAVIYDELNGSDTMAENLLDVMSTHDKIGIDASEAERARLTENTQKALEQAETDARAALPELRRLRETATSKGRQRKPKR
jgi:hypothetical protein